MTDDFTHADDARTTEQTMDEISHTNPYTDRPFGDAVAFRRGAVAADGGERDADPRSSSDRRSDGGEPDPEDRTDEEEPETMKDVSHEAPDGDSPQRTFERGTEGRTDRV